MDPITGLVVGYSVMLIGAALAAYALHRKGRRR